MIYDLHLIDLKKTNVSKQLVNPNHTLHLSLSRAHHPLQRRQHSGWDDQIWIRLRFFHPRGRFLGANTLHTHKLLRIISCHEGTCCVGQRIWSTVRFCSQSCLPKNPPDQYAGQNSTALKDLKKLQAEPVGTLIASKSAPSQDVRFDLLTQSSLQTAYLAFIRPLCWKQSNSEFIVKSQSQNKKNQRVEAKQERPTGNQGQAWRNKLWNAIPSLNYWMLAKSDLIKNPDKEIGRSAVNHDLG